MGSVAERDVETALRARLAACPPGSSFCPSEVARAVSGDEWRTLMPLVRRVVARLQQTDEVAVTQGGEPVAVGTARGPVRLAPVPGSP